MKTTFEEIIDINRFGENDPVDLNELAKLAEIEQVSKSDEKILFLGVDLQNDFLEGGALGVPDSFKDLRKNTSFFV